MINESLWFAQARDILDRILTDAQKIAEALSIFCIDR